REVLDLHDELADVAALAAAEAVEGAVRGPHVQRRGLLLVERAQALERAATGAAQRHVLPDDVVDPIALAYPCDVAVPDPSRHVSTLGQASNAPERAYSPHGRHARAGPGPRRTVRPRRRRRRSARATLRARTFPPDRCRIPADRLARRRRGRRAGGVAAARRSRCRAACGRARPACVADHRRRAAVPRPPALGAGAPGTVRRAVATRTDRHAPR